MNDLNIQQKHAKHYTKNLGLALVSIPKGSKAPLDTGWQRSAVTDPQRAESLWVRGQNMGVHHGDSLTCTVDVDNAEYLALAAEALSVDLLGIIEAAPVKIQGKNGVKPLFRIPAGVTLDYGKVQWPHQTERLDSGKARTVTVVEFRAGHGKQDVLPPSIHPDTGLPYQWVGEPPRRYEDIPELPTELLALWLDLERTVALLKGACPWAPQQAPSRPAQRRVTPFTGESVIEQYELTIAPEEILVRNGYKRRGERFISPHSSTKMAGVTVYERNGKRYAFTHHASDDWSDGHGKSSFSLMKELEHNGDLKAALDAAREELGLPAFEAERSYPTTITSSEPTAVGRVTFQPVWDAKQVQEHWAANLTQVLSDLGLRLEQTQMHHHARDAMWLLMDYLYTEAAEGNIAEKGGKWYIMCGGLKGLKAAGVPGRESDISARLKLAGNYGLLGRVERVDPTDRYSPLAIEIPPNPFDLPFLKRSKKALAAMVLRPDTQAVRCRKKPVQDKKESYPTTITSSEPTAVGRVNRARCAARHFLARDLTGNPYLPTEALRAVEALGLTAEATYLDIKRAARLELENDSLHRARYLDALEQTAQSCQHRLRLARFGVPEAKRSAGRTKALLDRTLARIERLRDGEPISEVRRWAS